jgi:hypothetical protein
VFDVTLHLGVKAKNSEIEMPGILDFARRIHEIVGSGWSLSRQPNATNFSMAYLYGAYLGTLLKMELLNARTVLTFHATQQRQMVCGFACSCIRIQPSYKRLRRTP